MAIPTNLPKGGPSPRKRKTTEESLPSFEDFSKPDSSGLNPSNENLRNDTVVNPFDDEEDEVFTPISPSDDELFEDTEYDDEPKTSKEELQTEEKVSFADNYDKYLEESDPDVPSPEEEQYARVKAAERKKIPKAKGYTEDTFIDEKNAKLKPFGSRGGRKAKVGEFDNRNNLRQRSKMVQWGIIALVVILVLLGIKNALLPPKTLSVEEVQAVVAAAQDDKGYPLDRGSGFAKDFLTAYLTQSSDPEAGKILSYFYNGVFEGSSNNSVASSNFTQKILMGPTLYKQRAITDNSASFVFGVLLENDVKEKFSSGKDDTVDGIPSVEDNNAKDIAKGKWSYFNVNVFYDKENDGFIITPDSPTITPPIVSRGQQELPQAEPIGEGAATKEQATEVHSVIIGYITGYAVTTPDDHTTIDQYIIPDPPAELLHGLGGRYEFAGEPNEAINFSLFTTNDPTVYKAEVVVNWRDTAAEDVMADYSSTYILTLQQQSNGKFLVSKFAPKLYQQRVS